MAPVFRAFAGETHEAMNTIASSAATGRRVGPTNCGGIYRRRFSNSRWYSQTRASSYGDIQNIVGVSNGFMMVLGDDGWLYGFGGGFGRRYGNGSSSFVSDTKKLFRLGQGAIPAGVKLVDYAIGGTAGANCALGSNGKAYCWGAGYYGSLGDGQLAEHEALTPIEVQQGEVPVGVTLESIACGTYHCIALHWQAIV